MGNYALHACAASTEASTRRRYFIKAVWEYGQLTGKTEWHSKMPAAFIRWRKSSFRSLT